jgi:hypothetical protein
MWGIRVRCREGATDKWGPLARERRRNKRGREAAQWGPRGSEPGHELDWLGRAGKEMGRIPVLWPRTGVSFLFLFIYFLSFYFQISI